MEWAVSGVDKGGTFHPDPFVNDTFDDPLLSLEGCGCSSMSVCQGGARDRAIPTDASDLVVALVPRPMKWAFAVYATTHGMVTPPSHITCASVPARCRLQGLLDSSDEAIRCAAEIFGVLVKDGLIQNSKHMFWDGEVHSDVISLSSDDFVAHTAAAMAEVGTRCGTSWHC